MLCIQRFEFSGVHSWCPGSQVYLYSSVSWFHRRDYGFQYILSLFHRRGKMFYFQPLILTTQTSKMMMKFSHRICFKHPDLLFGVFVFLTESVLSIQTCSLVYLYLCICVFVFLTESVLSIQTCSLGFLTILPRRRCSTSILRKAICSGKRLGILPKVLDLVLHSPSL